MIGASALTQGLRQHFLSRRWLGESDPSAISVEEVEVLRDQWPVLLHLIISGGDSRYQDLIGLRRAGTDAFPDGCEVIAEFDTAGGPALAYDGLADPELARFTFLLAAPSLDQPKVVRPVSAEQSNTSLVFDNRYLLKVYRKIRSGPSPDVEIPSELWGKGFRLIPEPLGEWSKNGTTLASVKEFLVGGIEGWSLAMTSLRDLFGGRERPDRAGGDLAGEAQRLGQMTAQLHTALAGAFGTARGDPRSWFDVMSRQLGRVGDLGFRTSQAIGLLGDLLEVSDPGPSIRAHGDYHLGQVMRTDAGWFVLDFEGEPARPSGELPATTSPLKDVAGMMRSFHYAAQVALRHEGGSPEAAASAWEKRNREAFLDGYVAEAGGSGLVPRDLPSFDALLRAFELDKAVYEVAYERRYRPDWVEIPLEAARRLVAPGASRG